MVDATKIEAARQGEVLGTRRAESSRTSSQS
jgi:hypothetical protein